jgi:AcrR family transcriptional regulator
MMAGEPITPASGRAPIGRPRSIPRDSTADPREEILDAAARLFSAVGYAATTTREIADAVKMRQGSLFHYFARKDDILAELLDRTVDPALAFFTRLAKTTETPEVKLFTLLRRDVENLCSGSCNLASLQLLPEARVERFDEFWAKRARLHKGYAKLIRSITTDTAVPGDAELATDLVFGLAESVITWYERGTSRRPEDVALAVAVASARLLGISARRSAGLQARSDVLLQRLH